MGAREAGPHSWWIFFVYLEIKNLVEWSPKAKVVNQVGCNSLELLKLVDLILFNY
jgi:hypothetical protein